jgi:inner membrane protein
MGERAVERTPGQKLGMAIVIAALLAIPLFCVYLLVYDRQSQAETARQSIAEGWGGPQLVAGPVLVLPYQEQATETVTEGGRQVTRAKAVWRELLLAPEAADIATDLKPERRRRSIYEAVVFEARAHGTARFALPPDLARYGLTPDRLVFDRAEIRFGLSDARGLFGPPPRVVLDGRRLPLQPGKGPAETGGSGFFATAQAGAIREQPLRVAFDLSFRGNGSVALAPQAADTRWTAASRWPHPGFGGGFLPVTRAVDEDGFRATWRVGNLALGRALVATGEPVAAAATTGTPPPTASAERLQARVDLV